MRDTPPTRPPAAPAAPVTPDPWLTLRRLTGARIALGRAGVSLPTAAHLAFQLDHARARDAVHLPLERSALHAALAQVSGRDVLDLHSAAADRLEYLQRPDLGRRLDDASRAISLYCDLVSRAIIAGLSESQGASGVDLGASEDAPVEDLPASDAAA